MSVSCKKQPKNHKVRYVIDFIEVPHWASSNFIEVGALPSYQNEYNYDTIAPYITYDDTKTGHWEYEYWELKDGDEIYFNVWGQLDYYYEMRVFIDDVEVGYKKIKVSETDYFAYTVIEESGFDDDLGDTDITFTYHD